MRGLEYARYQLGSIIPNIKDRMHCRAMRRKYCRVGRHIVSMSNWRECYYCGAEIKYPNGRPD